jgi:hypothetical protein
MEFLVPRHSRNIDTLPKGLIINVIRTVQVATTVPAGRLNICGRPYLTPLMPDEVQCPGVTGEKLVALIFVLLCSPYLKRKKMELVLLKKTQYTSIFLNLLFCTNGNLLQDFIPYSNILTTEYFGIFTM